ncbi:MAG TPA: FtsH protease activity modulator HflK [Burkholderiaceae bacterium]|jgi:membrane protease subunit HflK|nr:FtsH protease activity modulator HflK [Burkholderiaceae bacterium]
MSLNDPQWGRGGGSGEGGDGQRPPRRPNGHEGPPDLEELWRELNRRLGSLFGSGGGGGGGGGSELWRAGVGVAMVLAAILVIWMVTGFYIVQEGQVAVVTTFGRFDSITGAGFRWRAPWPIQSNEIVDVFSTREIEVGTKARSQDRLREALMLTDDENIVDVQFKVQYRIKSGPELESAARDFVFGSRFTPDGDPATVVGQTAESAMREVVGSRKMDAVLSGEASKQQIADEVRVKMQDMLDRYNTGIMITAVPVQNVQPPEQVQPAFNDAIQAGQDQAKQINEGQAYAKDVVPRARGAAARLIQEAEGYRIKTIENAQGDAARFRQVLAEYSKAPAVTRERLYLDTMQQIFSSTTKVLVDTKAGSPLLYLPFDKLLQQATDGTGRVVATPSGSSGSGGSKDSGAELRGRDAGNDRDREAR